MSVLSCGRAGCPNIMCDYYSFTHGYICNSCLDNLCLLPEGTSIFDFMNGPEVMRTRPTMEGEAREEFTIQE